MRRWNGWGEDKEDKVLPEDGLRILTEITGEPHKITSWSKEEALGLASKNPFVGWDGVDTSAEARLAHACGQSFPDWLAIRQGHGLRFPDGVVMPQDEEEVRVHLQKARHAGARIVVYGGGTSVVGHINRPDGEKPVVVMDMCKMGRLLSVDRESLLARFEAGVRGPAIEEQLAPSGLLLGHFPQSYEYSTLGGWIATRSSGQQSLFYGRIEDSFAGGRLVTAEDTIELPPLPASAVGMDLRHLMLGSEGLVGVITEATMRVRPHAAFEEFYGVFFPNWEEAESFSREAVQGRLGLSMMRLSSTRETFVTLALANQPKLIRWLERYLSLRGVRDQKCLMILGVTGSYRQAKQCKAEAARLVAKHKGVWVGKALGQAWKKNRFHAPYLRNTLWNYGFGVDTLETALPFARLREAVTKIEGALQDAAASLGEKLLVYTHLSHFYTTGSAIYTTYLFRLQPTPEESFALWREMKSRASEAILSVGGTMSHQHGVGKDHAAYVEQEKSAAGLRWMRRAFQQADPDGLFANGNLFPPESKESEEVE